MYDAATYRGRSRAAARSRLTPAEAAIIATLALAIAFAVMAGLSDRPTSPIMTDTIRVAPSETLWHLAAEHPIPGLSTGETVEAIKALNDLDSSALPVGEVVLVPAVGDTQAAMASR